MNSTDYYVSMHNSSTIRKSNQSQQPAGEKNKLKKKSSKKGSLEQKAERI